MWPSEALPISSPGGSSEKVERLLSPLSVSQRPSGTERHAGSVCLIQPTNRRRLPCESQAATSSHRPSPVTRCASFPRIAPVLLSLPISEFVPPKSGFFLVGRGVGSRRRGHPRTSLSLPDRELRGIQPLPSFYFGEARIWSQIQLFASSHREYANVLVCVFLGGGSKINRKNVSILSQVFILVLYRPQASLISVFLSDPPTARSFSPP